ncbi:MCE family protein [Mycolicibacter senuensis]|uniref:MCE family protein n=1 Tax=Mycolicibacter senuensis TaxID=386913 RepID=UPI000DCBCD5B|nr:MlaD family protein [Mycolicibacter senuensis]RAV01844.1 MCE family protein [Mycolicibacter senuensis]
MHLARRIWIQLAIFATVSITAFTFMIFGYMRLPTLLFGLGHYTVTVQLPQAGGLYERANVTYHGTKVGLVKNVHLTDSGVDAVLSLRSDITIPSDLEAEVHSVSAVGEQYISLMPRAGDGPPLKNGDVITADNARVPPAIDTLLDAANQGLQAIPGDNLKTTIDEAYVAFGGLGPDISRFVKGATNLATDARKNLDELTNVVDNAAPVLDTQTDTAGSVQAWAAHLADITGQLQSNDAALRGVLQNGSGAVDEARALVDKLRPTLPIVLANLVSIGDVAVTYRDNLEMLLVLLPQGTADMQAIGAANRNTKQDYLGAFLSFNLNLNLPPPCTTGFLPIQQQRVASYEDYPDRPAGDLYCRVPQDSPFNVRGARNTPCVTRPGKRAPTVKMCESDQNYVPLNDGFNWKGDPNATLSGQGIPQRPDNTPTSAPAAPAPPPVAAARYDPETGMYVGPDGKVYTQSNLARGAQENQTWQSMLVPPGAG